MRKRIRVQSAELVRSTDSRLDRVLMQLYKDPSVKLPKVKRNAASFFSSIGKNYDESRSVSKDTL